MWDIDVDYLFFRNNFATPEKLKQKLVESYGTYAYSCQCSWQNISDEYVPAMKVSNWVCGGHMSPFSCQSSHARATMANSPP